MIDWYTTPETKARLASLIAKAVGLDDRTVKQIDLSIPTRGNPSVVAEFYLTEQQAAKITGDFPDFPEDD